MYCSALHVIKMLGKKQLILLLNIESAKPFITVEKVKVICRE